MGKIKVLSEAAKKLLALKKAKSKKIKPGKKPPSDKADLAKTGRPNKRLAPWQEKQLPKKTRDRLIKQRSKKKK